MKLAKQVAEKINGTSSSASEEMDEKKSKRIFEFNKKLSGFERVQLGRPGDAMVSDAFMRAVSFHPMTNAEWYVSKTEQALVGAIRQMRGNLPPSIQDNHLEKMRKIPGLVAINADVDYQGKPVLAFVFDSEEAGVDWSVMDEEPA